MSGIEVAGLAFGVVPIIVGILKSYGTAKRRFITFSRHVEVVRDIQLGFQVAAANFNNECRLLLQAVLAHPCDISEMIEDPTHQGWQEQGKDIEQRLRGLMQHDYELCENIVTRLRNILCETQESLSKLDGSLEHAKQQHHEVMRKIWHAFNTSRKENEYNRQLECLNKWNQALSKLREQRCKYQKRRNNSVTFVVRKAVPRSYQQIRVASQHLGESLHDSWSCTNNSHSGHQAKLSLDAQTGHDDVQLDIVVACKPRRDETQQKYVEFVLHRTSKRVQITSQCANNGSQIDSRRTNLAANSVNRDTDNIESANGASKDTRQHLTRSF
jgi:hypothetical protein